MKFNRKAPNLAVGGSALQGIYNSSVALHNKVKQFYVATYRDSLESDLMRTPVLDFVRIGLESMAAAVMISAGSKEKLVDADYVFTRFFDYNLKVTGGLAITSSDRTARLDALNAIYKTKITNKTGSRIISPKVNYVNKVFTFTDPVVVNGNREPMEYRIEAEDIALSSNYRFYFVAKPWYGGEFRYELSSLTDRGVFDAVSALTATLTAL